MDILQTIKQSWRIIWNAPSLWLLALVRWITGGSLVGLTMVMAAGGMIGLLPEVDPRGLPYSLAWLRLWLAGGGWAALLLLWLLLAFLLGVLLCVLLAAQLRRADQLGSDKPGSVWQALAIGRRRLGYFIVYNLANLALVLLMFGPLLAAPWIGKSQPFVPGILLFVLTAPFVSLIALCLMYLALPLALADLPPLSLLRQAGRVFLHGWWAFLMVYVIYKQLPLLVIVPLAFCGVLLVAFAFTVNHGVWLLLGFLALALPIISVFFWFFDVFILTLCARVYREVQRAIPRGD